MQAMSYMGQGAAVAAPRGGIQYVVGTPPQTPVLRPLRQPLYDTDMFDHGQTDKMQLFVDAKKFQDGTQKRECDQRWSPRG